MVPRKITQEKQRIALLRKIMELNPSSETDVRIMDHIASMPSEKREESAKDLRLKIMDCGTEEELIKRLDELGIPPLNTED